jgi:hypothetical protein
MPLTLTPTKKEGPSCRTCFEFVNGWDDLKYFNIFWHGHKMPFA